MVRCTAANRAMARGSITSRHCVQALIQDRVREAANSQPMRFLTTVTGVVFMGTLFNLLFPWLAHGEMLKVGGAAPEFSTDAVLGDQSTPVKLSDYRGRKVVFYFYPKDN